MSQNASNSSQSGRQVLVNFGNRYVVFSSDRTSPQPLAFDALRDTKVLPRVADESEIAEERIIQTLRVSDVTNIEPSMQSEPGDVRLVSKDGKQIFVDVKVRQREPKERDYASLFEQLKHVRDLEIWSFNIERLGLTILSLDERNNPQITKLVPIDVWERTETGVFDRNRVLVRVQDWIQRINNLYLDVWSWIPDRHDLRADQSRTVSFSEDLMQSYAIADRDLPVLDIIFGDQVIVSFVPRALWIVGARGRIDLITRTGTRLLIDRGSEGAPNWQLVSAESRRDSVPFNRNEFFTLVSLP